MCGGEIVSLKNKNTIDGIAFDENKNELVMEIYDSISDTEISEYDHLILLQEKINTYLWFINNKQYEEYYPHCQVLKFLINIYFQSDITDNLKKFLNLANSKLKNSNISLLMYIG